VTEAMRRMVRLQHRIDDISYQDDRVVCTCGHVTTAQGGEGWASHRRAMGLLVPTVGQTIGKRLAPRGGSTVEAS